MILEITVENLAIIEQTQISLGPGFTVITGETGAGKSLLVDAIELALGERADADLVRAGSSRACVHVVVDLSSQPALKAQCQELGLSLEDNQLYIQREVFAEGRSQCRVGGKLTPVAGLRTLGQLLVDLHGQHDHQSLLHQERHMSFLDQWIGEDVQVLLAGIAPVLETVESLRRRIAAIRSGARDREQRIDLLTYQIEEIRNASPQPGELEEQEKHLSKLKHAERLSLAAISALEKLQDADSCALDLMSGSMRELEDAARLDESLLPVLEPLRTAYYSLEDATRELRTYSEGIDANPQTLEETAARIDTLRRLRRKYGDDEGAVLEFLARAEEELAIITGSEQSEAETQAQLDQASAQLESLCGEITNLRTSKAAAFSKLVESELHELAMERACFEVQLTAKTIDATGADRIEFFFSANAGEPLRPLAKIASGGEISRVMLAIKTVLAGNAGVPTLIFDEVDAGLSGKAAAVVAAKLEQLAGYYQVLVISHLPQIASRASAHYRIEKTEEGGRVRTSVRALAGEERIDEIGRMISGTQLSAPAREAARELLGLRRGGQEYAVASPMSAECDRPH